MRDVRNLQLADAFHRLKRLAQRQAHSPQPLPAAEVFLLQPNSQAVMALLDQTRQPGRP